LSSWAWGLCFNTTLSTNLDVDGVDANDFAASDDVNGSKHS
jgi:hypothetical protein